MSASLKQFAFVKLDTYKLFDSRFVGLISKEKLGENMVNICRAHPDEYTTQTFYAGGRSSRTLTFRHAPRQRVIAVTCFRRGPQLAAWQVRFLSSICALSDEAL